MDSCQSGKSSNAADPIMLSQLSIASMYYSRIIIIYCLLSAPFLLKLYEPSLMSLMRTTSTTASGHAKAVVRPAIRAAHIIYQCLRLLLFGNFFCGLIWKSSFFVKKVSLIRQLEHNYSNLITFNYTVSVSFM